METNIDSLQHDSQHQNRIRTDIQFVHDRQTIFLEAVGVSNAYPDTPMMIFHFSQDFHNFLENYGAKWEDSRDVEYIPMLSVRIKFAEQEAKRWAPKKMNIFHAPASIHHR